MKVVVSLFFIFTCIFCYGQSTFFIKYNVVHLLDTNSLNSLHAYNSISMVNSKSFFYSSDNQMFNDTVNMSDNIFNNSGSYEISSSSLKMKRMPVLETMKIAYQSTSNKVNESYTIGNYEYLITDTIQPIKWQTLDDTKIILGNTCQSAKAFFKGREWIVWFTANLNHQIGPWKLSGLPGDVLEAYDSKKQIHFTAVEAGNTTIDFKTFTRKNNRIIKVKRKQFFELYKAYAEDPINFIATTNGISLKGFDLQNNLSNTIVGRTPNKLKIANNPIELTEN